MTPPTGPRRVPKWLKGLGWLAFGILSLATLLVAARWLLMNDGHRTARKIVEDQKKKNAAAFPAHRSSAASPAPETPGIHWSAIPHFGSLMTGDKRGWRKFAKQFDEIRAFVEHEQTRPEIVDGKRSFRAVLQNLGIEVPDAMTEEEAAREYLKQADRFSGLLAQWREAVAKGPFEKAADSDVWWFSWMASGISPLLGMTTEARLKSGDSAGAWEDLQTLRNLKARSVELTSTNPDYYRPDESRETGLARLGLRYGAWTAGQMAEISAMMEQRNPFEEVRLHQERIKEKITDYYAHFDEHKETFSRNFLNTPAPVDQLVNRVKLQFITRQQLRDNMEVQLADADRVFTLFDPETGFYIRPPEDRREHPPLEDEPDYRPQEEEKSSFYFMIRDYHTHGDSVPGLANSIIVSQSRNDQFRLAIALESYKRETGSYPENLAAVEGRFSGSVPQDIATGQPYYYQKDPDGYTLWGTGIDGKSDGGDMKTDVTWKHRPVKAE